MDDTDHKMENGEMKHRYKITTRKIEVEYEQMLFWLPGVVYKITNRYFKQHRLA